MASMHPSPWDHFTPCAARSSLRSAMPYVTVCLLTHYYPLLNLISVFTLETFSPTPMCSASCSLNQRFPSGLSLSALLTLVLLTTRLYHSMVSFLVLHILGVLHRIILFAKNFHLPHRHHLVRAFFLNCLHFCVLFTELISHCIHVALLFTSPCYFRHLVIHVTLLLSSPCYSRRPIIHIIFLLSSPCLLSSIRHSHFSVFPSSPYCLQYCLVRRFIGF